MTQPLPHVLEMRGITKRFGPLVANDRVDFTLSKGEVHALLGENGAGKTTLMRTLFGLYHADEGEIFVKGSPVQIKSPKQALDLGIGMVTQHFALVAPMTVTENVILGDPGGFRLNLAEAHDRVAEAAWRYGIQVDPTAPVRSLSVGQRQRVEILKALYRQVDVLILDEPTAGVDIGTKSEILDMIRDLANAGKAVIVISSEYPELLAVSDRVLVLRDGSVTRDLKRSEIEDEESLQLAVQGV